MADLAGTRVLLVEDEGAVALLLESMLEDLGCEIVASAGRIPRALQAVRELQFDLAVLDVNVAGETSFELARLLAERGIPFIFSTGYGSAGLPEDLGERPVLSKPFALEDLRRRLSLCRSGGAGA